MFAIPMMKGTDEIPHLYRVLEISEGQIIKQKKAAEIPKNVYDYADPSDLSFYQLDTILEKNSKEKVSLEGTRIPSSYPPTQYVPQLLATLIAKLFNIGPFITFYLIRFLNLTVWRAISEYAIK